MDKKSLMLDKKSILADAINTYGAEAQIIVAIEEMSELTKALTKWLRFCGEDALDTILEDDILEELADVKVMLAQMEMIFGDPVNMETAKLERLAQRLEMDGGGPS